MLSVAIVDDEEGIRKALGRLLRHRSFMIGATIMLIMAIIAVFIAGLMVGRTPEYLGKKLGRKEVTAAAVSRR